MLVGALWTSQGIEGFVPEGFEPEFENVALLHDGAVTLAPPLEEYARPDESSVWCAVETRSGRLYAGTGNSGRVYRLSQGDPVAVFEPESGEILAMCTDARDNLFFGLTPDGTVYRTSGSAEPELLFETGASYVFSLLPFPGGDILCATGTEGKLYRITPGGSGSVIFTAPQTHLTALAWLVPGQDLLVGTAPDGIVYRLRFGSTSSPPEVSVLYDTPLAEVRSIAVSADLVYIAANPDENTEEHSAGVFCISLEGSRRWQWTCPDSTVFNLLPDEVGILVATGSKGMIFRLDSLGHHSIVQKVEEPNITCLLRTDDRVWVTTAGPGAVYRLGSGVAHEGYLLSEPHDCDGPARFGRLESRADVPAGTELEFDTRTGNSETPDSTWHEWQPVSGTVKSPNARFVQWRARFSSRFPDLTPVLRRVDIYYRAPNRPPVIGSVTVDGADPEEAGNGNSRPTRNISWEAEDPDGDSLVYEVQFKGEDETRWKQLAEDITETSHSVDTRALPDGWYRFRIKASDRATHPKELSLGTESTTLPVLVDNTPPEVTDIRVEGTRVSFTVRDAASVISGCRVSVNAGKWKPAEPEDGIFDATSEKFSLAVELEPGENTIAVQAFDAQGNTAAGRKLIRR
jgi:hypothetical protein